MKIALIMQNSQMDKKDLVYSILKEEADLAGHELTDRSGAESDVEAAVRAAELILSGEADYIVSGSANGEGAMIAMNAVRQIRCGLVNDAVNAYAFTRINAGNCAVLPFEKIFSYCPELNLHDIFRILLTEERGAGYPPEAAAGEAYNRGVLGHVKDLAQRPVAELLENMAQFCAVHR